MQIGVVFPQTEIGADPGALRAYIEAVAALGYKHVLAYDHVVGADPRVHAGWSGPYDLSHPFHEPMVLYGWLAAFSPLELVTGILIAPQRQTVLVAKQAAEVDVLSGGRLRLGLGLGWNHVEYEALGKPFGARGRILDEQIGLLRRLWTEETVTFSGEFETVTGAGLAPLPAQRPIPIWLGAVAPPALRRVGRTADGWFPQARPGGSLEAQLEVVREAATAAGRDPDGIQMEGRVEWSSHDPELVARHVEKWRQAGATHVSVNTMGTGCRSADDHIAGLRAVAAILGGEEGSH